MAASAAEKLKGFWDSQVNDEEQWALNYVRTLYLSPPLFIVSMNLCGNHVVVRISLLLLVILLLLSRSLRWDWK
jgi:hypothetical protein